LQKLGYYFYTNSSGAQCQISATGLIPQNEFSDPSTFVGNTTYYGQEVYHFASAFPPPLQDLATHLYVRIEEPQRPVAMVVPAAGSFWGGTVVNFITFEEVVEPFPDDMFTVPSYCRRG
jgi:hypothetical protein